MQFTCGTGNLSIFLLDGGEKDIYPYMSFREQARMKRVMQLWRNDVTILTVFPFQEPSVFL